jgi:DnaK suppressor protein
VSKPPAKPPAKTPKKAQAATPAKAKKAPAKTAASAKPAAKSAAKPAAKPAARPAAAKPPAKPAAKTVAKSPAKPAAKPAPAKPTAKPATKPGSLPNRPASKANTAAKAKEHVPATATKVAHPPAAKPGAKPTVQPAGTPVVAAPAKPESKSTVPATKPTHAAATAVPAQAAAAKPTASQAKAAAPAVAAVVASTSPFFTAPVSNRFTDRFAPARPAVPEVIEASILRAPKKIDPKLANAWKTKAGRELTEDELLAMPDSEYMNEKQVEFFRVRLTKQKDDLLSNAGETTEHLREDTSIVPDPVDRATIEEEHALELRTRDRERKLLKKISQSLARLESGDYGYCDETGEPIGLARLLARPTATLSLEAQQRRELKQKMFGD